MVHVILIPLSSFSFSNTHRTWCKSTSGGYVWVCGSCNSHVPWLTHLGEDHNASCCPDSLETVLTQGRGSCPVYPPPPPPRDPSSVLCWEGTCTRVWTSQSTRPALQPPSGPPTGLGAWTPAVWSTSRETELARGSGWPWMPAWASLGRNF